MRFDVEPRAAEADEDITATINYTSGTTARPKGVQMTHRNLWVNATRFGWQLGGHGSGRVPPHVADVPCNGWGMPYAVAGMGAARSCCAKSTARRSCVASNSTA